MMRLVIAAELASRSLIELKYYLAQLRGFRIPGGETLSVNFTQRTDKGVSVFAADFAILVAVLIVETCLAHAALHCDHSREHPPAGTEWQLNYARKVMFYARHHPDDEGEATGFTPVGF